MFEKLTDFSFQRNWKQAFGFYLAWLCAGIIAAAIVVFIYLHVSGLVILPKKMGFMAQFGAGMQTIGHMGHGIMPFVILLFSAGLSLLIMKAKNKLTDRIAWVCFIFAAALSLAGAALSFIPVAYLTTLPKGKK